MLNHFFKEICPKYHKDLKENIDKHNQIKETISKNSIHTNNDSSSNPREVKKRKRMTDQNCNEGCLRDESLETSIRNKKTVDNDEHENFEYWSKINLEDHDSSSGECCCGNNKIQPKLEGQLKEIHDRASPNIGTFPFTKSKKKNVQRILDSSSRASSLPSDYSVSKPTTFS